MLKQYLSLRVRIFLSGNKGGYYEKNCYLFASCDDASAILLARDISKKIEAEMEYPGQIKVVIIRETRAVDYAK